MALLEAFVAILLVFFRSLLPDYKPRGIDHVSAMSSDSFTILYDYYDDLPLRVVSRHFRNAVDQCYSQRLGDMARPEIISDSCAVPMVRLLGQLHATFPTVAPLPVDGESLIRLLVTLTERDSQLTRKMVQILTVARVSHRPDLSESFWIEQAIQFCHLHHHNHVLFGKILAILRFDSFAGFSAEMSRHREQLSLSSRNMLDEMCASNQWLEDSLQLNRAYWAVLQDAQREKRKRGQLIAIRGRI